jgi:hypothetical protein
MNTPSLELKNPKNWFAAGLEVQQAMDVLSDGAFKTFLYICLNARRDTGVLRITQTDLAHNLKKANGTIRKNLQEMETAGVLVRNNFRTSPVEPGTIQIAPCYWPYETADTHPGSDGAADGFIVEIRKALAQRACIRSSFSTADEALARQWFHRGVPLDRVRQAILMGCGRKYVSWRNNPAAHGYISSLRYFDSLITEIEGKKIDPDYWGYIELRMQRHEQLWIRSHDMEGSCDLEAATPSGSSQQQNDVAPETT